MEKQLCCYCGVAEATTKDHIPPKSIFNKPLPSDLITVPCCFECNNDSSKYDELFKAYLGMHVSSFGIEGARLFKQGVIPTVQHNHKLRNEILSKIEEVEIVTPAGIYMGKAKALLWDSETHEKSIEKLTRGLFFHCYNKILPKHIQIDTYWFNSFHSDLTDKLYKHVVANGAFIYFENFSEDSEMESMWLYEFYGSHWAGAVTTLDIR